jgi:hypothetical protein
MRKNPQSSDFGVEYAVYMMDLTADNGNARRDQALGNTDKTSFPDMLWDAFSDPNLDARSLSPYTSAVPEKDMILDPRADPLWRATETGDGRGFLQCRVAAN